MALMDSFTSHLRIGSVSAVGQHVAYFRANADLLVKSVLANSHHSSPILKPCAQQALQPSISLRAARLYSCLPSVRGSSLTCISLAVRKAHAVLGPLRSSTKGLFLAKNLLSELEIGRLDM